MTTATLGEVAAGRCAECKRHRDGGYQGDTTGWFVGDDGERHNHLRGSTFTREDGAVIHADDPQWMAEMARQERLGVARIWATGPPARPDELTPEELEIAQAMGLSEQQVLATKRREAAPSIDTLSSPRDRLEAAKSVRDAYFPGISDEALRETLEREEG